VTVEFPANSGTDVGTFGTVAGSPIPEPADFAALGGVLSLGLVALRRRKNVVA